MTETQPIFTFKRPVKRPQTIQVIEHLIGAYPGASLVFKGKSLAGIQGSPELILNLTKTGDGLTPEKNQCGK